MRKSFNSKEQYENKKAKKRSNTRIAQAKSREEKEAWLASPDGQATIARLGLANSLSTVLAPLVVPAKGNQLELEPELSDITERLAEKVAQRIKEKSE